MKLASKKSYKRSQSNNVRMKMSLLRRGIRGLNKFKEKMVKILTNDLKKDWNWKFTHVNFWHESNEKKKILKYSSLFILLAFKQVTCLCSFYLGLIFCWNFYIDTWMSCEFLGL